MKFSIFSPTKYIKESEKGKYRKIYDTVLTREVSFSQEEREVSLIAMMKINYLKRLESSVNSFVLSLHRLIEKIDGVIDKINEFKQETTIKDLELYDIEDFVENDIQEELVGSKVKIHLSDIELEVWKKDLLNDRREIYKLYKNAVEIDEHRDKKLNILKQLIANKIKNPLNKNNKKILIFTAYSDTANYIYNSLEKWCIKEHGVNIGLVLGSGVNKTTFKPKRFKEQSDYESILVNFSPISKVRNKMNHMPQDGEIDILIATDCISEGQNLQDCYYLINFDIHWNPVRIIQRFGRIDRIGSKNKKIQLVNF